MSDDDTGDDIIAESSSPIPSGALYLDSPSTELGFRYHRPKYDTVRIGRGESVPNSYLDPDDIPDDSCNPERIALYREKVAQDGKRLEAMIDRHLDALTPRERKLFENDTATLERVRTKHRQ